VTFFVDANVIVYTATEGGYRDACLEVLEAIGAGHADGRTSSAVLEEAWYVERSGRLGELAGLAAHAYRIFTPLLSVTDDAFRLALAVRAPALGPADLVHAGTCLANEIDVVLSADAGFDAVRGLRRVDPLDARARRRLLSPS